MRLTALTADEARDRVLILLGDGLYQSLESEEIVAESLRRAASFMCPTNSRRIVDAVVAALQPLTKESLSRVEVGEVLDRLIAWGDLIELPPSSDGDQRRLYLGPPSYIDGGDGRYLLSGIRPFGAPLLEGDIAREIARLGHARTIKLAVESGSTVLRRAGLRAMSRERWVGTPARIAASELIGALNARLDTGPRAGHIEGLRILDPETRPDYYAGRWREPASTDSGTYLARRPQAYGAELWSLVRLESGPSKLLDFPLDNPLALGSDEAWRYQAAVDAERGVPQIFRVVECAAPEPSLITFYSPLPRFAERYLDIVGTRMARTGGSLFAYSVPPDSIEATTRYLRETMWLEGRDRSYDQ